MPEYADQTGSQDAVEQRVRNWAVAVLGVNTIFAHPNAPRPPKPYCMLNLISGECVRETGPVVYEEVQDEDTGTGGEERIVERRASDWEWTFSVHLYGDSAMDMARTLTSSLGVLTVVQDHLHPLAVRAPVFGRRTLIRRVPELVNETWENRANFDLTVAGIVLDGFLIDVIEQGVVKVGTFDRPELAELEYVKPE